MGTYFLGRCTELSAFNAGWQLQGLPIAADELTAGCWLIERRLDCQGDREVDADAEEFTVAAIAASRMIAECEHEDIFAGPPASRLLRSLGGVGRCGHMAFTGRLGRPDLMRKETRRNELPRSS